MRKKRSVLLILSLLFILASILVFRVKRSAIMLLIAKLYTKYNVDCC